MKNFALSLVGLTMLSSLSMATNNVQSQLIKHGSPFAYPNPSYAAPQVPTSYRYDVRFNPLKYGYAQPVPVQAYAIPAEYFLPQPAPAYVPASPSYVPASPAYVPASPAYVPAPPSYVPAPPSYVPASHSYAPAPPSYVPASPSYVPASPSYLPAAPAAPAVVPKPGSATGYIPPKPVGSAYIPRHVLAHVQQARNHQFIGRHFHQARY